MEKMTKVWCRIGIPGTKYVQGEHYLISDEERLIIEKSVPGAFKDEDFEYNDPETQLGVRTSTNFAERSGFHPAFGDGTPPRVTEDVEAEDEG